MSCRVPGLVGNLNGVLLGGWWAFGRLAICVI